MLFNMNAMLTVLLTLSPLTVAANEYKVCQQETRETLWGVDRLAAVTMPSSQDCSTQTARRHLGESWGRQKTALPDGQTVVAMYDGNQHSYGRLGVQLRPEANWAHTLTCQYADQVRHIEYHVSDGLTRNGLTRVEFDNDSTLWIVAFDTTDSLRAMDPSQAATLVPEWLQVYLQMNDSQQAPWIVATAPNCWEENSDKVVCHTYKTLINQFDKSRSILLVDSNNDNSDDLLLEGRTTLSIPETSVDSSFLRKAGENDCHTSPWDQMTWDIAEQIFA